MNHHSLVGPFLVAAGMLVLVGQFLGAVILLVACLLVIRTIFRKRGK